MSCRPQLIGRSTLKQLKSGESFVSGLKYHSCQGRLTIPNVCQDLKFSTEDLIDEGEIGRGAYGFVNRMLHRPTKTVMAVKRIRSTLNEREQRNTLKDLDVVMNSANCPNIVLFYGAIFTEGDCWICMEMMATSLDKFYKFVYNYLQSRIPENIIGKITTATVSALDYLKTTLKVIHRDVKPSNILIDCNGNVKLCDFGISGQLVDSIARSRDAGCKPYMAPERIHPELSANGYDIRSDVWSLGITLIELSTGQFPYPSWNSVFEQLTCVLHDDPPSLPECLPKSIQASSSTTTLVSIECSNNPTLTTPTNSTSNSSSNNNSTSDESCSSTDFSPEFRDFVSQCLEKDVRFRPKYQALMNHPFYLRSLTEMIDVGKYFQSVLDKVPSHFNMNEY
ncbi:Dual specificity mitogen-activated protein kinase kinase 2 isoform 1 [Schistosoma japonicum]|uniref:mitogen-activated protein kinase kinase n=2 Tax=Schistosoma japonicum TaxID=6182 RepID=A0A4Z2DFX9_SCHJA|nr:Dual specificity mitogen-activated protein kinase kinase 2 isoform 1 [Schistosoma japonicum]